MEVELVSRKPPLVSNSMAVPLGTGTPFWVTLAVMVTNEPTTGSGFEGFLKDRYTTLEETDDRILATVVTARWRYASPEVDWAKAAADVRRLLLESFAGHDSRSLQHTLYAMGEAVLAARPEVAEIRMSMPNKHHLPVDLTPYGLRNDGEVFVATDRPFGLIEGTVVRDGAPPAGPAWA